ncbi:SDR family NAD(P)-dependent oxidoreductase [Streptomyces sp. NPDC059680]|uniref:SDR family NAD(P)-dependent oxidoreductase n=1 Tax=Streptomyces sp. NPDC059680 TaxID=3346904 RepID=UPI0036CD4D40
MTIMDQFRLDGTCALVTGASRGIGKAVAIALAEAGSDVAVSARTSGALDETVHEIEKVGRKAHRIAAELAHSGAAAKVVDHAASYFGGRLDILVHNAGIAPTQEDGTAMILPLQDLPMPQWEDVISVNVNASAAICRAAHRYLNNSDKASVVLMSSVLGLMGAPRLEAYGASKAAQISLARSLAVSWARDGRGQKGIRVNALCPGWTLTDMTKVASEVKPLSDWLINHVPNGRWASVDEVTGAAVFLASQASSYVTGHALVVDGGLGVPDSGLAGFPKPQSPLA